MKEVKQYICEGCGTQYADKVKAEACEDNHKRPLAIQAERFLPIANDRSGYPISVTIKMEDGKEIIYKR